MSAISRAFFTAAERCFWQEAQAPLVRRAVI